MAKPKFFYEGEFILNSRIVLSEIESRHAVKARRLREGDDILLLNGRGGKANARLVDISNRKSLIAQISAVDEIVKADYRLEIATAIPKGDRQKVMLDMLTQIGVTHITPLDCEHSVTQAKVGLSQRWQRGLIESSKQSERAWLPEINKVITPQQLIEQRKGSLLIYCHAIGGSLGDLLKAACFKTGSSDVVLLVGPEGGFSDDELTLFKTKQLISAYLAPNILRIETAAIVAAAQIINLL